MAIGWLAVGALIGLAPPEDGPTVGMPARIDQLMLPGTELEVKAGEGDKAPIVLRIAESYAHGTAFRYDLVFYGLEPGAYDLKGYLIRKDGSTTADLPAIPVQIRPILPPGSHATPHGPSSAATPRMGGYRTWSLIGMIAWTLGLLAIVFGWRKRKSTSIVESRPARRLGDRLRPLVTRALQGELPLEMRPELERALIACWLHKLGMEHLPPAESLATLRAHPEAGPILRRLEEWLHRPDAGPGQAQSLRDALLPLRNLPAEAWEPVEVEPQPAGVMS